MKEEEEKDKAQGRPTPKLNELHYICHLPVLFTWCTFEKGKDKKSKDQKAKEKEDDILHSLCQIGPLQGID